LIGGLSPSELVEIEAHETCSFFFNSRGAKLLSAMRHEFGGHKEKAGDKQEAA
jgi:hypothetical protein